MMAEQWLAMMRKRHGQAQLVNTVQAEKVRLAIRWGVPVSEISERSATRSVTERLLALGEDVLAWLK